MPKTLDPAVARLVAERKAQNLTRDKVAQLSGIHVNSLLRYEHLGSPVTLSTLRTWAAVLSVPLTTLFTDDVVVPIPNRPRTAVPPPPKPAAERPTPRAKPVKLPATRTAELSEIERFIASHPVTVLPSSREMAAREDSLGALRWDAVKRKYRRHDCT